MKIESKQSERKGGKSSVRVRQKACANGRAVLYLDIYANGKRSYEFLDLHIEAETDDKVAKKNAATMRKAEKIVKARAKELAMVSKIDEAATISAQAQSDPKEMLLSDWMDTFYNMQRAKGIEDYKKYPYAKSFMMAFDADARLCDITVQWGADFVNFLKGQRRADGDLYASKTMFGVLAVLKTAINAAVRAGYMPENPLMKLSRHEKIHVKETPRDYLTIDEIKMLMATPCEKEVIKQAYLFACNCGLRLGDIQALTWGDISIIGDKGTIRTRMAKTKRDIVLPIGKQAIRWLPARGSDDEKVFKGLNEHALTKYLQPWADAAGVKKNVTFYTSRHSFATTLLTLGADLYTVSKLLGHTSIRHTQRYAQIINKVKDDAVSSIDDAMSK